MAGHLVDCWVGLMAEMMAAHWVMRLAAKKAVRMADKKADKKAGRKVRRSAVLMAS